MDGLPIELAKLCDLASLAECGDHLWASVPALSLSAGLWMPMKAHWAAWRGTSRAPAADQLQGA